MLDKNEFGELVKAYRKQRGWTQEELAERWGYSRGYVTQIERGQRKLDSTSQVVRLADILDIPQEKLESIGRGIPERKKQTKGSVEADDSILQMLLTPGRDMVRLSWIAWIANQHPTIEGALRDLTVNLEQALVAYNGAFIKPAQQLLAYAHQMQGKMAFDHLDYAAASGHFSEMIELGRELNDADIIAVGIVQQGDLLRKRGRYETALRCFESAKPYTDVAPQSVQSMQHVLMARGYYCYGDEQQFTRSINAALEIASSSATTIDNLANQVTLEDILEEQAAGYTTLWKPEKAIEIYKGIDRLFRPLRNQGSYLIDKSQVYFHLGDFERGTKLAVQAINLASEYRSKRHIARLEATYNRLRVTALGKDKRLATLRDALIESKQKQADW